YWVKLVRTGNSFRGYMSPDGGAWTQVGGAQTIAMGSTVYVGLPVTAHDNADLCTATFDNVWTSFPAGSWQHQDIGSVGQAGNASDRTGPFSVIGAGADIWGTADAFNFAYLPVTGNCTVVARVTAMDHVNVWSKAGVMIRESLDANSVNAYIAVTPSNGVSFQYRSTTGGNSANNNTTGLSAPYWVRLVRSGNTFTGYRSPNGVTWTQQGSPTTINMASTVYVGLAVTSHDSSSLCAATFDNVTLPGWLNWTVPLAPTGLSGVADNGQAALTWLSTSNATSYNVKRSLANGGPYSGIASVTATNVTDTTGLTNGVTYYYVVSASNPAGESANSAPVALLPRPPMSLTLTSTNLTLSWPLASAGFTLQFRTNLVLGSWEDVTSPPPQVVGEEWQVELPPPAEGDAVFYRLAK
ncbi:MAG TPA: hypothetical protein VFZ59_20185, partial [Verrucomicrobiae bacterium]|nr:hypothetical protein [Verrucomicrobiae bacterium]